MTDTLQSPTSRRVRPPRGRRAWIAAAAAAAVALGVTAAVVLRTDAGQKFPVVQLTPVNHEVIYEVVGTGAAPVVTWVVGERNRTEQALNVPLPWRTSLTFPVGPAGGYANVEAKSPESGAGSLGCRVFVDGVLVQQQTSTDGFASVSCAAQIAPKYVD